MASPVFKLIPGIQGYDWGKKGSASLAAQLASQSVPDFQMDQGKTYAELWMGTHPSLPSKVSATTTLQDHLCTKPEFLGGDSITTKFPDSLQGSLPFLFKVLSIGTALSIQAHPDKVLAKKLFDERPNVYKDSNHKPEMAIALTPFLAFLNFLPLPTLLTYLVSVPELSSLIPNHLISALTTSLGLPIPSSDPVVTLSAVSSLSTSITATEPTENQKSALKNTFEALMSAPTDLVKSTIDAIVKRYKEGQDVKDVEKGLVDLTIMLNEQYPGDVGVLCVYFLNVVELNRGQAAFLGPNMPHAYIKGDIIECMATSDNVVRAGLTPKLRDVPTLISMLTYKAGPASAQILQPTVFNNDRDDYSLLYDPPIDEFSVIGINLPKGFITCHRAIKGPSLMIITNGEADLSWAQGDFVESGGQILIQKGDVVFMASDVAYQFKAKHDFEAYRAFVEA